MKTIAFEADIENGWVKFPQQYMGLSSKQVKIVAYLNETASTADESYSDEYIEKHWRELIAQGLSQYDEDFYKSDSYKAERGAYLAEKYR